MRSGYNPYIFDPFLFQILRNADSNTDIGKQPVTVENHLVISGEVIPVQYRNGFRYEPLATGLKCPEENPPDRFSLNPCRITFHCICRLRRPSQAFDFIFDSAHTAGSGRRVVELHFFRRGSGCRFTLADILCEHNDLLKMRDVIRHLVLKGGFPIGIRIFSCKYNEALAHNHFLLFMCSCHSVPRRTASPL